MKVDIKRLGLVKDDILMIEISGGVLQCSGNRPKLTQCGNSAVVLYGLRSRVDKR